jgi:hypothetical protein
MLLIYASEKEKQMLLRISLKKDILHAARPKTVQRVA